MNCVAGAVKMAPNLKAEMDFTEANKENKEAKDSISNVGITKRAIPHSPTRSCFVLFVAFCQLTTVLSLNSDYACH